MDRTADKVKTVAVEEVKRIEKLTNDAARSGAYLYPIRGIYYFLSHKSLWYLPSSQVSLLPVSQQLTPVFPRKPLTAKLAPTLSLALIVTTTMFLFTYLPQAAVMTFTSGPVAAISAGLLVLSESSTLTTVLSKAFLVQDALTDTFDGTLLSKSGTTQLVGQGRQVQASGSDPITRLGKLIKKPFEKYTPTALVRYLMFLPLNAIPFVGTVIFVILQGRRTGPGVHDRYFQLKGWNREQKRKHIEEFSGAYTSFGVAAVLLELVPVASVFFAFTNTVGAALWAADLEKGEVSTEGTSPNLREQVKKAE